MSGVLQGTGAGGEDRPGSPSELAAFFEPRPRFRRRLRGYDPADVEDYVAWVEEELLPLRQDRGGSGRCSGCSEWPEPAALAAPAVEHEDRDAVLLVDSMRAILELAEERADAIVAEAEAQGERIRAAARAEADARMGNVVDLRAAAAAVLEEAREQAGEVLRVAAAERDRLDAEAADRRAREGEAARRGREEAAADAAVGLAAVAREVDDLLRQRDEAREALRRLTGQIGAALDAFAGTAPEDRPAPARRPGGVVLTGNVVVEPREPVAT